MRVHALRVELVVRSALLLILAPLLLVSPALGGKVEIATHGKEGP